MQTKPIYTFMATIVALLLIGGGYYVLRSGPQGPAPASSGATSTPSGQGGNANGTPAASGSGSQTVTLVTPDYMKPIAFSPSSGLTPDIQAQLTASLKKEQSAIKANPLDLAAWLNLGSIYKIGGDLTAARDAWEYMLTVVKNDVDANYNLGDLYQNSLKDYPKAEEHYLAVIAQKPNDVETYVNLYTMYRYQYKTGTSAAADIIAKGLKANPGNDRLLYFEKQLQAASSSSQS